MTNHPGIRAALMAAAGTLALTAAACGAKGTTASGTDAKNTVSASPSAGSGEGDPGTAGGTNGGTGGTTTATTKPPAPKPSSTPKSSPTSGSAAVIVSFKVLQQPVCERVATADAPFQPAKDVIISWKVTGATKVALSMDGGLYGSDYGLEDQQSLYFACPSGDPHPSHTYTITTSGGGASKSQSLTVTISSAP